MSDMPPLKSDSKFRGSRTEYHQKDGETTIITEGASFSTGPEDVIAVGAVVIAIIVVVAAVIGWVPLNSKATISLLVFSGVSVGIAQIVKAKRRR